MYPFGFHDVHLAMVQAAKRDLKAALMSIAIPKQKTEIRQTMFYIQEAVQ